MRRAPTVAALVAAVVVCVTGCDLTDRPDPVETTSTTADVTEPEPEPTTAPAEPVLLLVTDQKDGDSWVASDGVEYRLGMVDTPEVGEPCSEEATAFTRDFLAGGFTVDAYSSDTYGRSVAEVLNPAGASLNVALARSGLGGDRYFAQFRHENPDLALRLDDAFASAALPQCSRSTQAAPLVAPQKKTPAAKSACMAGYSPCLPIVDDLNCPDIGHPVTVTGNDPYRLDRDGDGTGCDS